MSANNQFIESYVGNPQYLELLRAILGLTQYEGAAFIAVALTAESSASATRIAENAAIPRPKIYSTLNSLVKKGLVIEVHEQYKVNVSKVEELMRNSKELLDGFQKFVERVVIYSRTSATKVQAIKSIIKETIQNTGYHFVPIERKDMAAERKYMMVLEDAIMYSARSLMSVKDFSYAKIRDLAESNNYFIDELVESSTSGIKVSINILTEEKYQTVKDYTIPLILATAAALRCEAAIIITVPEVMFDKVRFGSLPRVYPSLFTVQAHEPAIDKIIYRILSDLDRNWTDAKREVDKIGSAIMELKIQLTSTLDSTYQYVRDISKKEEKHKKRYLEILERIQADLITSEDILSAIRREFEQISERLEQSGKVPESTDVANISKRVSALKDEIQKKIQARDQLLEDILAHIRGGKAYIEYGYVTNPFVFTVPPEYPRDIVNQKQSREQIETYFADMIKGSARNFAFVCADEGMGKTHFLNFYSNELNNKKFGNAIALRLNCKPKSDIIDLYAQIPLAISRLVKDNIIKAQVIKTLETAGTPKNVNDFINLLRQLNSSIMEAGFEGIFLLIDDFENTLPTELSDLTPRSILQLTDLVTLENMGIVVAIRAKSWELWNKEIRNRIPKIGRLTIIKLEKLGPKETQELLQYRLDEKDQIGEKEPPNFDNAVSEKICLITQGIPRQIISLAREIFRVAILEKKRINMDLVESVKK